MSASTPILYNSCASAHARGYSSSWSRVLSVTNTCAPKRWAYSTNVAISLSELPAAWRAPNSGAPIYTASAPACMAAIPTSRSRAGANNVNLQLDMTLLTSLQGRNLHYLSILLNSYITIPAVTLTLSECLVPYCGISIQPLAASTTSCCTPKTSCPMMIAVF